MMDPMARTMAIALAIVALAGWVSALAAVAAGVTVEIRRQDEPGTAYGRRWLDRVFAVSIGVGAGLTFVLRWMLGA